MAGISSDQKHDLYCVIGKCCFELFFEQETICTECLRKRLQDLHIIYKKVMGEKMHGVDEYIQYLSSQTSTGTCEWHIRQEVHV